MKPSNKQSRAVAQPHGQQLLSSQDGDKLVWNLISQSIDLEIQRMMKDQTLTSEAFDSRLDSIRSQIDKYRKKSDEAKETLKKHVEFEKRKKELKKQNNDNNPKPAKSQTQGTQDL